MPHAEKPLEIMRPGHPKWVEFLEKLNGPECCNFQQKTPGDAASITWNCKGGRDKTFAIRLLQEIGFSVQQIVDSCAYFDEHGGYCDCEIIFNVDVRPISRHRRRRNPPRKNPPEKTAAESLVQ
jgi:hypothetical protein